MYGHNAMKSDSPRTQELEWDGAPATDEPRSKLQSSLGRLESLTFFLQEQNQKLEKVSELVFGPSPQKASGEVAPPSGNMKAHGVVVQLDHRLDMLEREVSRLHGNANALLKL